MWKENEPRISLRIYLCVPRPRPDPGDTRFDSGRLRLRPDTLPIGYSDSSRILLIKRKDSAFAMIGKRILVISELAIRRAEELLPFSKETWISSRRGTVALGFGF